MKRHTVLDKIESQYTQLKSIRVSLIFKVCTFTLRKLTMHVLFRDQSKHLLN